MPEYTYLDIFATKGLEYMVVMVYFVLLVVFMKNLGKTNKSAKIKAGKD